ncbi:MAG TPA: VacJ family lipoprotein, partial [Thioalkalivibrio sp.]|nr:VacJ family lipoprotein [Thioalkalivibrio sp.]
LLSGCSGVRTTPDPRDPWEGYNRAMFEFNDSVDRAVLKPVAKGYRAVTPKAVDRSVTNFFANVGDIPNAFNNALQGKLTASLQDLNRVVYNTTFGLGGLFDVASHMGLPRHDEDFGQTLGVWGVNAGPYFVLPILGPSTVRDAGGRVVDGWAHPLGQIDDERLAWSLAALKLIDLRADLLDVERMVDDVAYDRYVTIRNAYLDRREFLIYDGNPPEREEDDLLRELELLESQP